MKNQPQFFEQSKMTLQEAIDESLESLREYGSRFPHWVATYSGGKDSTGVVTLVGWAIKNKLVDPPKSFRVLLANTKLELIPLITAAEDMLKTLQAEGIQTQMVIPELDNRVFVAMLGRGLPPFNNGRRTCTRMLKGDPMVKAVSELRNLDNTLFLSGVRLGESRSRDHRIAVSCSSDSGECGQGWFQNQFNDWGVASLAPLVHWRACNVFDWLYFEQDKHGYDTSGVLEVYGESDIRTGCMACFAVEEDKALKQLVQNPKWSHLEPILKLKQVYSYLGQWSNRLRMPLKFTQAGKPHSKSGVVGPLTMEARKHGLDIVLNIQGEVGHGVELISDEELNRIYWHWRNNTWPRGWTGNEQHADVLSARIRTLKNGEGYTVQSALPLDCYVSL